MRKKWFCVNLILMTLCVQIGATASAQTDNITAFIHVNLIPMTAETIIPDQTVLVEGSRINAIGPSNRVDIPDNSTVINGSKAYLLPGLTDMHMHTNTNWLRGDWPVSPFYLYLVHGVTSIRCFGSKGRYPKHILYWREGVRNGNLMGPTMYVCGKQLRGHLRNPEKIVREKKAEGYDFIKLYSYLTKDEFQKAISTAKAVEIYSAGHIPFQVGLDRVLSEGMNEIAHIEELFWEFVDFDRNRYFTSEHEWMSYVIHATFQQYEPFLNADMKEMEKTLSGKMMSVAEKVGSKGIPICTTLSLDERIVEKLFEPEQFLSKPENRYLPNRYLNAFKNGREKHQMQFRGGEVFAPFKRKADLMMLHYLKKAGVPLVLGTDAGTGGMGLVPGFSVHQELRVLTRNGFTPYEAIRTATVNAAHVVKEMTGAVDFGTIEVGKRADLILISGNPFDDINFLSNPQGVMASGRWYDKSALNRMVTPGIPVVGAIQHVNGPDGISNTYAEIVIGKGFTGKLPDAIESIAIIGPNGKLPVGKDDFTYLPTLRDFWIRLPGTPEKGIYRFEVTGAGKIGSAFDYQYDVRSISTPDSNRLSPANGAKVASAPTTFSWNAVESDKPLYYQLEIKKPGRGRVYLTKHIQNMVSHTVPAGVLQEGQTYLWRIRITDSDNWLDAQNRTHSKWQILRIR